MHSLTHMSPLPVIRSTVKCRSAGWPPRCAAMAATAEPFPGLRVIQDRVRRVDGVLGRAVPLLGGPPTLHDVGPGLSVAVHRLARQVRQVGPLSVPGTVTGSAAIEVIPARAAAGS